MHSALLQVRSLISEILPFMDDDGQYPCNMTFGKGLKILLKHISDHVTILQLLFDRSKRVWWQAQKIWDLP